MIRVIFGEKGAGKTKRILKMANEEADNAKGSVVFIDDDSNYMFDLKRSIRFINASEYSVDSPKMFYGFICGLTAQDFDLEAIYIDGFLKIVRHKLEELEGYFASLEKFAKKFNLNITISISGDPNAMPEYLNNYMI
jgi:hypothetical protein